MSRASIIIFLVLIALGIRPAVRYMQLEQVRLERTYYHLGVATQRIMDPSLRKGIAVEGAWVLRHDTTVRH